MTAISPRTPTCAIVSSRRLRDTAVTPSERSIENATTRRVRRIAADQRDVGAVQRRHRLRRAPGRRVEHEAREIRGRRVRHGVVGVDDVEALAVGHLRDGVGQREQVLRLAKERVRRDLDLVEEQPRHSLPHPERRLAADDVNAMAANRECVSQLGRDYAAAADRGVAHHADVHVACFSSPGRWIGSRTTIPSAKAAPASAPNCASRLSINWRKVGALSRVPTAPCPDGVNWLRWQSRAARLRS